MLSNPWSGALYGAAAGLFLALVPGETDTKKPEDTP
ncbi:hypothetical protein Glov_2727 [Trichlorobacter lovleyi SZ]|uniref:Uncharacterized protein n=1 Tax=Trichlorobacter lovleyi (strain ATCC BAA-1151 / DSM 17278 / SZ) TaxID=398767 RepID=B3E7C3_TRIL1|nr:hypothetical protein Glov_2727 [Trichlorobacter lovleyi SZ]